MDDTDKTPMEASDNTESVESTENAAENGDAGGLDDDLDALLAGAFPEQSENSTDNASGEPESADVMDILKAAGADIMDEPEQKKEKKGFCQIIRSVHRGGRGRRGSGSVAAVR